MPRRERVADGKGCQIPALDGMAEESTVRLIGLGERSPPPAPAAAARQQKHP